MSLPLPQLDTRTYEDLVSEAVARVPSLQPEWTNYNPSDPGVVLIELLAWLTEMVMFRIDQVTDENTQTFLKLLNGPKWVSPDPSALEQAVHETMVKLRERYRAITVEDFEYLATAQWPADRPDEAQALGTIQRAHCVPQRNLTDPAAWNVPAPGHLSLVIVPDTDGAGLASVSIAPGLPQPTPALCQALWQYLDERRLLTVRHHVIGPAYVRVELAGTLFLQEDARAEEVLPQALSAVQSFFHPARWPLGRNVYLSEVYAQLRQILFVSRVEQVALDVSPEDQGRLQKKNQSVSGVTLHDHELVNMEVRELIAQESFGGRYKIDNAGLLYHWTQNTWQPTT